MPDTPVTAQDRTSWIEAALGRGHTDPCGTGKISRAAFVNAMQHAIRDERATM